ncbi:unnamed protein product [Meganyctiphanes norvegica]|uniref:Uncharacterized protein n=1 Tax=Meganyctiphanes norvegica TaxID=48144 RepID=A0AAV2Q0V7_MEGNR
MVPQITTMSNLCKFSLNFAFFLELCFVISGGLLVLLVLRYQVIHVGLSFSEFHLVHTLTSIPMQESLSPEHSSELLADTLENLLDSCGVTNEGRGHLKTTGRNVTDSSLDIVRDPFNKE